MTYLKPAFTVMLWPLDRSYELGSVQNDSHSNHLLESALKMSWRYGTGQQRIEISEQQAGRCLSRDAFCPAVNCVYLPSTSCT